MSELHFIPDEDRLNFDGEVEDALPLRAGWRILAVDDDQDFQGAVAFALKDCALLDRPIQLTHAFSMAEATRVLAQGREFAVVLVDVVMETEDAGLRLVKAIRDMLGHADTRIILLTGQPGFAPIDSVMERYDLTDYCLKSDLNKRGIKNLLLGSLRSYRDLSAVSFARRSLNLILETSNRLVAKRSNDEIASIVLQEIASMLSLSPDGILCVQAADDLDLGPERVRIIGKAGRWSAVPCRTLADLHSPTISQALLLSLLTKQSVSIPEGQVIFFPPHLSFESYAAFVATDRTLDQTEYELLNVFVDTAARGFGTSNLLNSLERQAFVDPVLPDVGTRNALLREVQRGLDCTEAVDLNVLKIDIDNFNGVLSTFGGAHALRLVKAIRDAIRKVFPAPIFLARIPPDIFYVLGPADLVNLGGAQGMFDEPMAVDGNEYDISACMVLVPLRQGGGSAEEVLSAVRSTMRVAKQQGPGTVQCFNPKFEDDTKRRFAISSRLARGLQDKELRTFVQPQIDLSSGRPVGGEVLLRWFSAEGSVNPAEFIPIAEHSALIHKVGQFVIRQSLQTLQVLEKVGLAHLTLSINVSPRELENEHYVSELLGLCVAAGVEPARIELEVLESAVMRNFDRVSVQLAQFRQAGGAVAIDDFGTGMSSLSYLMELPHDRIKVDRSFIAKLDRSETCRRVTGTVIELGQSLGKQVIAEGVETQEQVDWLQAHGCTLVQGWHFARAMEVDEFVAYCRR